MSDSHRETVDHQAPVEGRDIPEKPKRQPAEPVHHDWWHRGLALFLALSVALPVSLAVVSHAPPGMVIDIFLIAFMLCLVLFLAYQGALWVLRYIADQQRL